ncbi:MAG: type II toxin-antitoxin system death-on-curing family toxin [Alphaproteobacteria bacterium]|nr:type II toxin-antitoxin system death-on-curing family toxin [Alphaproteobacteria bacterium]
MAAEPHWVTQDEAVAFNRAVVGASGEQHELVDAKALQNALAHPWNVWVYFMDRDIAVLAARLYTSIAASKAFAAGNKRTAFRTAAAFIERNGCRLDLPPEPGQPVDRLLGYFDGKLSQTGVVDWFRLWMIPCGS